MNAPLSNSRRTGPVEPLGYIGSKLRYDRVKAEHWLAQMWLKNAQPPASGDPEV
jgi:hypothetical protein